MDVRKSTRISTSPYATTSNFSSFPDGDKIEVISSADNLNNTAPTRINATCIRSRIPVLVHPPASDRENQHNTSVNIVQL
ncbi:hypothetical protein SNE40_004023 [Patella caerulea]|uniref:Uncharacterized protein n=1 Tax=Patella caerulea TaxID=87958 RepID=A0AAN8K980_PATCE